MGDLVYKYHPIIEGLKIREDGKQVFLNGEEIKISPYKNKHFKVTQYRVNIKNGTYNVAKLVLEAFKGLRPNPSYSVQRIFDYESIHYTNLMWAPKGSVKIRKIKRSTLSKIKESDIPVIIKRLKAGETQTSIAKDYDTHPSSIMRIKKSHLQNDNNE